ncbi:UNVERIFIED_CONTAM: hypothetical protein Sangu_0185900 [Sesamum angustifolium]|uniref:CCHC-type domain-containing protein n=1 Tax=Sesamum angustifolium TaxID=2727405 RepID=A0AAW2RM17_9LAMI
MPEGSDLAQHVNVFNQIITNLSCLDVSIKDEDRAMIMLCLLPFSYEYLVTTLTYRKETIKVDEIIAALLAHNQQKQNVGESSHGDSLYVKGNQDHGWKLENESSEKQNSRSKSRGKKTIYCYKCNEPGHMKRYCPKLKKQADEKLNGSYKSANVVQNDNSDYSDGDMLSVSTNEYVDAWNLDFVCFYHITPNRSPRASLGGRLQKRLGYEDMVSFAFLISGDEPTTFHVAITSQEKEWMGAMVEEMESLQKNHTCELVQLLEGKKTIGCKWM